MRFGELRGAFFYIESNYFYRFKTRDHGRAPGAPISIEGKFLSTSINFNKESTKMGINYPNVHPSSIFKIYIPFDSITHWLYNYTSKRIFWSRSRAPQTLPQIRKIVVYSPQLSNKNNPLYNFLVNEPYPISMMSFYKTIFGNRTVLQQC